MYREGWDYLSRYSGSAAASIRTGGPKLVEILLQEPCGLTFFFHPQLWIVRKKKVKYRPENQRIQTELSFTVDK
jgi:hypothetical protein